MSMLRKWVVWGLGGLGAVWLAGSISHAAPVSEGESVPAGQVWIPRAQVRELGIEVAAAGQHVVDDTLVVTGTVALDEMRSGHVLSPVTGRVTRIVADLGQHVRRGEPLAVVESPDVGSAVSDAHKAEADFVAADHDFRRKRELLAHDAATAAEVEASEDNERNARAELERARQKQQLLGVGAVDSVSQTYVLRSPVEGEVLLRNVFPGVEIQGEYSGGGANSCVPGVGTSVVCGELFTVGPLDAVWAMGDLYETDIPRVHVGAAVRITAMAYPGQLFQGTVDWISPVLDPTTRTAKVRCTFENRASMLRPFMYLNMAIAAEERRVLAVPSSAIVRMGEYRVVFAELDESAGTARFERVPVDLDETLAGEYVPVRHGVEPGRRIVVRGATALAQRL
jgi:cobalt-zinc-cadmium efflux system membrane fusion protein